MATPSSDVVVFARDELDLIVEFAGCSLDESPGSNWVQEAGGLPEYICRIARAVKRTGKTTSQAISIAVSRVKVWATGKGVDKDTQAKAAAAVAEWEKLRAKSHAKSAVKKIKASRDWAGEILVLSDSVSVFNVDNVRNAWDRQTGDWRAKYREAGGASGGVDAPAAHSYIKELWTDHLIVCAIDEYSDSQHFRVDYTVNADGEVTFGEPQAVKAEYVAIDGGDMVGRQMSNSELRQLMASVGPCYSTATDRVLLSIGRRPSALSTVLAAPAGTPSAVDALLKLAADKQTGNQYGSVAYADTKNKKYPVDTEAHVRAAWSYINQAKNQKGYSPVELAAIKGRIRSAAKKFNVEISG